MKPGIGSILDRLRALLDRSAAERELEAELALHVEMQAEANERAGMSPAEARREALLAFGGVERHAEACRDERRWRPAEEVSRDVRHALRALRRDPAFAAAAVLTLALGIGATTAVFGVADAVLLKSLPVHEEDRVVVAWLEHQERGFDHLPFSLTGIREIDERSQTLEGVAAMPYWGASDWAARRGTDAVPLTGSTVTGNFFQVLGVEPALGRLLAPEDDVQGGAPILVISHGLWQRLFGGDPGVLSQTLRIDDRTYTIVGVAPQGFALPAGAEAWTPIVPFWTGNAPGGMELTDPRLALWDLVARVAPGASVAQARADLDRTLAGLAADEPERFASTRMISHTLPEVVVGDVRSGILVLAGAVALLLLIAGVNVANLLVVRGMARRREFAVRAAIGAGRGRVVRQLLVETLVLAVLGGALGVAVAWWGTQGLLALAPVDLPRLDQVGLDVRVLGFAALVTFGSALVFGLVPAMRLTRSDLHTALRSGAREAGPGAGRRGREALVVAQVALTVVVLAGAGLLMRSLERLQSLDPGFRPERLVIADVAQPFSKYKGSEQNIALFDAILERVRALPGVGAAAAVLTEPFAGGGGYDITVSAEGQDTDAARSNPMLNYEGVEPGYFETLGLALLGGRTTTVHDRRDSEPVVVINEATARLLWPGQDAVGKRLKWGLPESETPWRTVIGVVADMRYRELREVRPSIYVPYAQGIPAHPNYIVVRTREGAEAALSALRAAVAEVDPDVAVLDARPMEQALDAPLARPRFHTVILGLLAALAVVLSAIGIYGTIASFVRQRTRELGVRMALGAGTGSVRLMVLRQGALLGLAGAVLGLAGALALTRLLRSLLFEISPTDTLSLAGASAVVFGAVLLASWIPARQATRVDPAVVLRTE